MNSELRVRRGVRCRAGNPGGEGALTEPDPLFVKCREVNDLHHAKDAYLNIVVGNVYHCKFTNNPAAFIKNSRGRDGKVQYNLMTLYKFDIGDQGGRLAWDAGQNGEGGSIVTVRRMMAKNSILFTRMALEERGKLFDVQIVPAGKGQLPIKTSDARFLRQLEQQTEENEKKYRYGGYNSVKGSYFCLVESKKPKGRGKNPKEEIVRSLQPVYLMNRTLFERDPEGYLKDVLGMDEGTRVILPKIRMWSLLETDGCRMHLTGRSSHQLLVINANQLILSADIQAYVKRISKYLERAKNEKEVRISPFDGITAERNAALFDALVEKMKKPPFSILRGNLGREIEEGRKRLLELSLEEQCRVLMNILKLLKCVSSRVDLSLIGGKANVGIKMISPSIGQDTRKIRLVHQSITGFYEQSVDLATVGPGR